MTKANELYAPESYWTASGIVKEAITNGCGPGGWKYDLVPDTIYGLSIHAACDIHDFMYAMGETIAEKDEADRVFLNNCIRLIYAAEGFWAKSLRYLRLMRAKIYFEFVHLFGGPSFWAGKNSKNTIASTWKENPA